MAKNEEIDTASSAIVSVKWLHDHLKRPDVKILDASWYMPIEQRNPFEEFKNRRIPSALFFDIDAIGDLTIDLPHMLPSEAAFAAAISVLGIQNTDKIVVYDGKGLYSAARVWWMFRVFGHEQIVVLDGGLPQWIGTGYEVETGAPASLVAQIQAASQAVRSVYQAQQVDSPCFKASFQPHVVWSLDQVRCNIEEKKSQLIDARSKGRYDGVEPEPRRGLRGGHIPGSKCIPFTEVLGEGGKLLSKGELKDKFKEAGVSLDAPIVLTCGSAVTACILALALYQLGKKDVAIYDGSWSEWGAALDTPAAI